MSEILTTNNSNYFPNYIHTPVKEITNQKTVALCDIYMQLH